MKDAFQLKIDSIENTNDTALSNFQQEKAQKDEENKQLKEKLEESEAEINHDNDLSYDSPEDDDHSANNDINYDSSEEEDDNNDINYDSPDDDDDANNDINYDTECSDNEQDTTHITSKAVNQNLNKSVPDEVYADPNYDFSDNEDRTNDICLD
jgi:hypothetical protein